ncbi:MAG: HAMP domain-containing histidine kinase [Deltaproteobacteria bacterium]|nr:HAMP domain-containing histidine kinase [Deltaproteobacteria bacterium]
MARPTAIPERNWVNIHWLARLRWAQTAGQAMTVLVGQFLLEGALPIASLFGVIGIGLVSNLLLELYFFGDRRRETPTRNVYEWQLAVVMMLDVGILTGLLYLTGGPDNPFGLLYVVQIALATVLLRAKWAWLLGALSFVGFGLLLVVHQPLQIPADNRAVGAWVALGVASAFVVHFLQRIHVALGEREAELTEARHLAARQERLASLATMAAGAAHELSTPLGTVALAAKELERALTKADASATNLSELAADARLIREQVGRCRAILEQMAQGAGTVGELLEEALLNIRAAPTVHRDVPSELANLPLRLPPRAVSQALRSLVTNAQDASPHNATVVVAVRGDQATLSISIRDRGPGMPSEILARIGEPFFTTKAPGRGMGLGLFLARAVIEGVGGNLLIDSIPGDGTEVRVTLPTEIAPVERPVGARDTSPQRDTEARIAAVVSKPT